MELKNYYVLDKFAATIVQHMCLYANVYNEIKFNIRQKRVSVLSVVRLINVLLFIFIVLSRHHKHVRVCVRSITIRLYLTTRKYIVTCEKMQSLCIHLRVKCNVLLQYDAHCVTFYYTYYIHSRHALNISWVDVLLGSSLHSHNSWDYLSPYETLFAKLFLW